MTHVVTESCVKCKYTDCVDVCPVAARFAEDDLPKSQQEFLALNAELSKKWPVIGKSKDALPEADEYAKLTDKRGLLER